MSLIEQKENTYQRIQRLSKDLKPGESLTIRLVTEPEQEEKVNPCRTGSHTEED
jgi:hypothetical protein